MKHFAIIASLFLLTIPVTAWSPVPRTRQEFVQSVTSSIAAAAVTSFVPLPAQAASNDNNNNNNNAALFNHQYSDPKHPNCKRIIAAKSDGTASLSGTDGNPACPEDGSGTVWRLPGEVEGNTILVDFTAKGGPPNLKGVWDGDGIKWPDGNKWTIKN